MRRTIAHGSGILPAPLMATASLRPAENLRGERCGS
jgi:hypothetical protein